MKREYITPAAEIEMFDDCGILTESQTDTNENVVSASLGDIKKQTVDADALFGMK